MAMLEAALLTTAVVGAGMSAFGQYREGMDAGEASRYNADISRQSAEMTETSGALDAERQRKQVSRLVGSQKAKYGASGVELTGSPLDVMIGTATEGELDAQIIEYNTKVKARGYQSQAEYDEKLAGIYERSGIIKAGSTLLTQGAQIGAGYLTSVKTPTSTSSYQGTYGSMKLNNPYRGY